MGDAGTDGRFAKLLVHVDPRQSDDPAVRCAVALAHRWQASLTLFDVQSDLSWPLQYLAGGWETLIENVGGEKHKALQDRAASLAGQVLSVSAVMGRGRLASAIISQVKQTGIDLVIKVAEGHGPDRSGFLGSTDHRLLRDCPCPILILHPESVGPFQRVAVALDVMDEHELQIELDRLVLQVAREISEGELRLIYAMPRMVDIVVVDPDDTDLICENQLDEWDHELRTVAAAKLDALERTCPARASSQVLLGAPEQALPDFVETQHCDLLVMGTAARSGLEGMLVGNTAERIFDQLQCSVLALKLPASKSRIGPSESEEA
ncbi:MAG: universal stress protein [Planctomycetota bacterium]